MIILKIKTPYPNEIVFFKNVYGLFLLTLQSGRGRCREFYPIRWRSDSPFIVL